LTIVCDEPARCQGRAESWNCEVTRAQVSLSTVLFGYRVAARLHLDPVQLRLQIADVPGGTGQFAGRSGHLGDSDNAEIATGSSSARNTMRRKTSCAPHVLMACTPTRWASNSHVLGPEPLTQRDHPRSSAPCQVRASWRPCATSRPAESQASTSSSNQPARTNRPRAPSVNQPGDGIARTYKVNSTVGAGSKTPMP
jgi:hypothetical protein